MGDKRTQQVIDYQSENGDFKALEDLIEAGLSEKMIAKLIEVIFCFLFIYFISNFLSPSARN
ncbi:hypothetical protein BKA69DRAFT_1095164 [Paraphysoderma sedebokerense]|nr:hypothetical protein BKA69DRAFT_1095164 [Paraphysoderma sedebokerense]